MKEVLDPRRPYKVFPWRRSSFELGNKKSEMRAQCLVSVITTVVAHPWRSTSGTQHPCPPTQQGAALSAQKREQPKEKQEGVPLTWIPLLPPLREGTEVGPSCEQGSPRPEMIYHSPVPAHVQVIHAISSEKDRAGGTPEKQKININMYILALGLQNFELTKCWNGSGALHVPPPVLSSPLLVDRRGQGGKEIREQQHQNKIYYLEPRFGRDRHGR